MMQEKITRAAMRWKDPAYRAKHAEQNRAWEAVNRKDPERLARKAAQMRAYRKTDEYKVSQRAHGMVRRALDSGKMIRSPCQVCGEPKTEAHHPDYSKPLDVEWLCKSHHVAKHHKPASNGTSEEKQ